MQCGMKVGTSYKKKLTNVRSSFILNTFQDGAHLFQNEDCSSWMFEIVRNKTIRSIKTVPHESM